MILVVLPALIVSGAALAGFLGGVWWIFDLLANLRPQYAVVGMVLGVVCILGRWRRTGAAVVAVALINAGMVGWLWVPVASPPASAPPIRVLSFNVAASNEARAGVFDYIGRIHPDVVFIHEATRRWEDAARESDLGYEVHDVGQEGLIFSTLVLAPPGSDYESFGFAEAEPRAVEVRIHRDGTVISMLGIHPLSPTTAERAALRNAQIDWASRWAADVTGPALVVGDFNASPWSHAFRDLLHTSGFVDSTRGFGLQPSFPMTGNPFVRVQIDEMVHNDGLVVVDRRLGPALGSDHAPLIVDVAPAG